MFTIDKRFNEDQNILTAILYIEQKIISRTRLVF